MDFKDLFTPTETAAHNSPIDVALLYPSVLSVAFSTLTIVGSYGIFFIGYLCHLDKIDRVEI